jgi:hypothetical protein
MTEIKYLSKTIMISILPIFYENISFPATPMRQKLDAMDAPNSKMAPVGDALKRIIRSPAFWPQQKAG